MLETINVLTCLLRPILPTVEARTTLLIFCVESLKGVSILEVHFALAMSTTAEPLPVKDTTLEEENSLSITPILLPLPIVDATILAAHYAEALLLPFGVSKSCVDLARRKFWR